MPEIFSTDHENGETVTGNGEAQVLEEAAKQGDSDYIRTHHGEWMKDYEDLASLIRNTL